MIHIFYIIISYAVKDVNKKIRPKLLGRIFWISIIFDAYFRIRSDSCKCVLKSVDKVLCIFSADRKTDSVGLDTLLLQLFLVELCVCCCCGVDNERLGVSNICQQREDLQVVDELFSLGNAALDLECEDRTAAVGEILLVKLVCAFCGK